MCCLPHEIQKNLISELRIASFSDKFGEQYLIVEWLFWVILSESVVVKLIVCSAIYLCFRVVFSLDYKVFSWFLLFDYAL